MLGASAMGELYRYPPACRIKYPPYVAILNAPTPKCSFYTEHVASATLLLCTRCSGTAPGRG